MFNNLKYAYTDPVLRFPNKMLEYYFNVFSNPTFGTISTFKIENRTFVDLIR